MPFPTTGPTTRDLVKDHLRITGSADDTVLDGVVGAVNAIVRSWPVAQPFDTDPAPAGWSDNVVYGSTLLAARLFRRRNTPDGVAAFSDSGPVYLSRNDPDVALLLEVGNNKMPAVG